MIDQQLCLKTLIIDAVYFISVNIFLKYHVNDNDNYLLTKLRFLEM